MKRILIATAALAALSSFAQPVTGAGSTPGVPTATVNPFNNTPLSVEELQKQLRLAQLQTQFLEEQLKQATVKGDLETIPARKAVETAQARVAQRKEQVELSALEARDAAIQAERDAAERARKAAARPAPKATGRKGAATAGKELEQAPAPVAVVAPAPAPPAPSLLSVLQASGGRAVVLDFEGNTLVAADGDMTPQGPVKILGPDSASVGGRTLKVRGATLSRFVVSDIPPPDKNASSSAATPRPGVAPTTASVQQALAAAARPAPGAAPAAGTPASLPALQLPPGVAVLPPPTGTATPR